MNTLPPRLAGIGGIVFAVTFALALIAANPPGGRYDEQAVADFVAEDHRVIVVAAIYLLLVGVAGLVVFLTGIRDRLLEGAPRWPSLVLVFWVSGLLAAGIFAIAGPLFLLVPASLAMGGAAAIDPKVTYMFSQAGAFALLGSGAVLMALALAALIGARSSAFPRWILWLSGVVAVLLLLAAVFLPFFALFVWALAVGVFMLRN